jgi:hypothetical protein
VLEQKLGEGIVHEYLENLTVFQADKQAFAPDSSSNNFDVTNDRIKNPLSLSVTLEIVPKGRIIFMFRWHDWFMIDAKK